jgi:hypothetical protein
MQGEMPQTDERVSALLAQKFEIGAAIALCRRPSCRLDRIHNAIARCDDAQVRRLLRTSRQAYITDAIKNEYAPITTADERRELSGPEHLQEQRAIEREKSSAAQTSMKRALDSLSALAANELDALIDRLVAETRDPEKKNLFDQNRRWALKANDFTLALFDLHSRALSANCQEAARASASAPRAATGMTSEAPQTASGRIVRMSELS